MAEKIEGKIKGYKVFNPDWTCKDFKYVVGKTYSMDEEIHCCERGFHFCEKLLDCFSYYAFSPKNKVAEIEASGLISRYSDKCCTNTITIVKELTWQEVLQTVNSGSKNNGIENSGNYNRGNSNSGDMNNGNYNSGDNNHGNANTGGNNTGDRNSGSCNFGQYNSGSANLGGVNAGCRNIGKHNSGDYNTGNGNSGQGNRGDHNSGSHNYGCTNSGDKNHGHYNSGDRNIGSRNSGDWNRCNGSSGVFNTVSPKIMMFNKPSDWTLDDWLNSNAKKILTLAPKNTNIWVGLFNMQEQELEVHPEYKVTGGYLGWHEASRERQIWWNKLSDRHKEEVMSLPNFDAEIFEECTGIKVQIK